MIGGIFRGFVKWTCCICIVFLFACSTAEDETSTGPNIIYILADDLGIGDVSIYNTESKIATPAIDALAREGMMFTDAHSGSAVCSPTRYGILTGRYAWRSRLEKGVTWTYDAPLIETSRLTVASYLKQSDYQTGCIGKWHLGLDWDKNATGDIDFTLPIKNGPNQLGFDYFFGITASLDIPPYFYIENDRITATSVDTIEAMGGKKFWRKSVIGNDFVHEEVLPKFTEKALDFIAEKSGKSDPFFLYFPLTAPHTPILPTDEFLGKSNANEYGDFVVMVDDVVRQISKAVDDAGIRDQTMIIFTSDNGCSPMADFEELATYGHDPSYIYRGHKADIYEGGHRIPFIVKWPDYITEGGESNQTVCLTDLLATVAAIIGDSLPHSSGEDSYNLLPILDGQEIGPLREATVHHSINGSFAIRQNKWKLNFCPGSGGWSYPRPELADSLNLPPMQLFDLDVDPGEERNVVDANPVVVKHLTDLMRDYTERGRSTPGARQTNDRDVTFK